METESPPDLSSLAPELQKRVRDELEPDERLIWVGQPIPKLVMWSDGAYSYFWFGLFWTGLSVIFSLLVFLSWRKNGVESGFEQILILLLFTLFFVVGIAFLLFPFWKYKRSFQAIYALTDKRAIIWKPVFPSGWDVQSTRPDDLGIVVRKEYYAFIFRREFMDGSGDVILQEFTTHEPNKHSESEWIHHRNGFFAIRDVKAVEALVRKTLLEKSETPIRIE